MPVLDYSTRCCILTGACIGLHGGCLGLESSMDSRVNICEQTNRYRGWLIRLNAGHANKDVSMLEARSGCLAVQDARTGWHGCNCETGCMVSYEFATLHVVDHDSGIVASSQDSHGIRQIGGDSVKVGCTESATVGIARAKWYLPTATARSGKNALDGMAKRTNRSRLMYGCFHCESEKSESPWNPAGDSSLALTSWLRFSRGNNPPCT